MSPTTNGTSTERTGGAKAVLGVLSLLVIGGVLGVAVDRHILLSDSGIATPTHGSIAADLHEAAMASFAKRLDLRADQRRRIESIMIARRDVLQQTWEVLHAELGAAVDSVHREVEAVLTPDQQREFREWLREMQGEGERIDRGRINQR